MSSQNTVGVLSMGIFRRKSEELNRLNFTIDNKQNELMLMGKRFPGLDRHL